MTREELFSAYPRPWRLCEEEIGVVLCADGGEALTVDTLVLYPDEVATAMAELIIDLVNGAEE